MVKSRNVGGIDLITRYIIGAVLLIVGLGGLAGMIGTGTMTWTIAAVVGIVVGLILLYTGATHYCPINNQLGRDTTN